MPKKTLTVTAPDGTVFTRKTDRRYSYAVLGKRSEVYDRALYRSTSDWAKRVRDNHAYYLALGAGTHHHAGRNPWETDAVYAERRAKEIAKATSMPPTADEHVTQLLAKRDARIDEMVAEGYYAKWVCLGWNGRLDLAQKLAHNEASRYTDITIVGVQ